MLSLSGCMNPGMHSEEKPLARAFDKYLYPSDLQAHFPKGLTAADSLHYINNFVTQWVRKQSLLEQAEFNLDLQRIDLSPLIEDYRASLLIHEYQKQLLAEKIDTVVTNEQIERYYESNMQEFSLNSPVVKALYIRIQKDNSRLDDIKKLLENTTDAAFQNLIELSYQYADRFDFFEDRWTSFTLIVQNIPGSPDDHEAFLKSGMLLEVSEQDYVHFLKIHDYRLSGETAPLEYVNQKIRDLVITERRMDYIKGLEESVYQDAIGRNQIEVFEEK